MVNELLDVEMEFLLFFVEIYEFSVFSFSFLFFSFEGIREAMKLLGWKMQVSNKTRTSFSSPPRLINYINYFISLYLQTFVYCRIEILL